MNIVHTQPSTESQKILAALQDSVSKLLDTKQKLGHYTVVWVNDKPILQGVDAPTLKVSDHHLDL